jgi:hypothetical protein
MEKQTALDWIIETLYLQNSKAWKEYIQQAREMEKEQIREAYEAGVRHNDAIGPGGLKWLSEEYYTENYGE